LSGFGLKDADVNMDLVYPSSSNPAESLAKVYRHFSQLGKLGSLLYQPYYIP